MNQRPSHKPWSFSFLILGLVLPPFLIFARFIFGSESLGVDYVSGHLFEPVLYRYYSALGIEPMWEPLRTGGIPFSGNPSAQIFHFPRWLWMQLPGFMSGQAVWLLTIKHVCLLIFGHTLLYSVLRQMTRLPQAACYIFSFLAIYNLSTLDSFRYGIALDTLIYSYAVIALSLHYLRFGSRWTLFAIAGFIQLTITAAYYPTLPFLGIFAASAIAASFVFMISSFGDLARRTALLGAAAFCGLLLAAPNWMGLIELLNDNYRRLLVKQIEWSNLAPLEKAGLFFNFFRPWNAEVHSGFGGTALLGMGLGALGLALLASPGRSWLLIPLLVFPFQYAMGTDSKVFVFFYKHVPGFSSMRVPGRILAFLPMAALIAVTMRPQKLFSRGKWAIRLSALASTAALAWSLQSQLKFPGPGWNGAILFNNSPEVIWPDFWTDFAKQAWLLLGLVACALIAIRPTKLIYKIAFALTFAQTIMMIGHGAWHRDRPKSMTTRDWNWAEHLPVYGGNTENLGGAEASEGFATTPFHRFAEANRNKLNCYYPLASDLKQPDQKHSGTLLPFYFSNNLVCKANADQVFEAMRKEGPCGPRSLLKTYITANDCQTIATARPSNRGLAELNQANALQVLTPNVIEVRVNAPRSSYFVTRSPRITQNWNLTVDGKPAGIETVNGAFVGARVPAGQHVVRLEYVSKKVLLGYRLFVVGLLGLALLWIWLARRRRSKTTLALAALIVIAGSVTLDQFAQKRVSENAKRDLVLHNGFQETLAEQLARWRQE